MAYHTDLNEGDALRIGDALVRIEAIRSGSSHRERARISVVAPKSIKIEKLTAQERDPKPLAQECLTNGDPSSWQTPSTTRAASGS